MPILQSENSKKREELIRIKKSLKDILKNEPIADYPKVKEYIEQAYSELRTFRLEERKLLNLTGRIYSIHEFLEIIKKVSGDNSWEICSEEIVSFYDIEYMKNAFDICFESNIIKMYEIARDVRTRNEVFLINAIALPGLFSVRYETERAGCIIEGLVNEQEMIEELQKEFSQ